MSYVSVDNWEEMNVDSKFERVLHGFKAFSDQIFFYEEMAAFQLMFYHTGRKIYRHL